MVHTYNIVGFKPCLYLLQGPPGPPGLNGSEGLPGSRGIPGKSVSKSNFKYIIIIIRIFLWRHYFYIGICNLRSCTY